MSGKKLDPGRLVWIDKWIGTPLCGFTTLFEKLFKRSSMDVPQPEAIVFIEIAEIGALFVAYPAVRYVREKFPKSKILFITATPGKEALQLMGFEDDEILLLRITGTLPLAVDSWRIRQNLSCFKNIASINLEPFARFSSLLAYWLGARTRVGYHRFLDEGNYTGDLVTHRVVFNPRIHASQGYLALAQALDESPGKEPLLKHYIGPAMDQRLAINLPDAVMASITAKLSGEYPGITDKHQVIVLNANTSDIFPPRRWAEENFVKLAHSLLEKQNRLIVLTGTAGERPLADTLKKQINDERVINLAGKTSLAELLALYKTARLLITNDSGPAHFSGAVDINAIVLFGPETPSAWGPLNPRAQIISKQLACSPCISPHNHKQSLCTDNQCMKQIPVEEVTAKAEEILAKKK